MMELGDKFTEYLISLGYKTYRRIGKNHWNKEARWQAEKVLREKGDEVIFIEGDISSDISEFYLPIEFNTVYLAANFNCMQNGGITVYFVKDLDFDKGIRFGLNEFKKPPMLSYPRPKIKIKQIVDGEEEVQDECFDDSMSLVLSRYSPEEIYEAMFNNNKCFEIDLTV
jgi:hypothetical protein